jgi:hypothetical protein
MKQLKLVRDLSDVSKAQVFSGGACNILDADGNLLRNTERDPINEWLTEMDLWLFDPQIHPDTHGEQYDYRKHHLLEIAARNVAGINLYEVSPRTFGGITSLEIASDHFREHEPMVIYFSDGNKNRDVIPAYSTKGHPLFVPFGIEHSQKAKDAHYREFIKNGNNMRKYLMSFARIMDSLTVTFGSEDQHTDVVISPERMHAADLFRAVVSAASGERVIVTFTGGPEAHDEFGNPRFLAPSNPPEIEQDVLLDQYVDEGNELRRAIASLVEISVFVRVVYTQKSVLIALEEVLQISGLI